MQHHRIGHDAAKPPVTFREMRNIRIEIQRGNTAIKVDWPVQASDDCAAWLRDWLR